MMHAKFVVAQISHVGGVRNARYYPRDLNDADTPPVTLMFLRIATLVVKVTESWPLRVMSSNQVPLKIRRVEGLKRPPFGAEVRRGSASLGVTLFSKITRSVAKSPRVSE
ncbi:hypothetical protein TNCV_1626321 [Trichonephila clavipes]|nr:hypothetical protein TNCV_1626321 [Trichonephila clavipes]